MKKGSIVGLVVLGIVIVLGIFMVSNYNTMRVARENVDTKAADIDTYLVRRADLIPNLVSTVKGYAQHEEKVISDITTARENLVNAKSLQEKADADASLTSAINALMVVVESYPDLKSSQNFTQLSDELAGTENRIAVARKDYNDAVNTYNTTIKKLPNNLFANMFGFEKATYFEASEGSSEVPNVAF